MTNNNPECSNKCTIASRWGFISIALAILIFTALRFLGVFEAAEQINFTTRRLRYTFTLQNKGSSLLQDSEVRIFAPLPQTASQKVLSLNATEPFEKLTDPLGNQQLVFKLTIPPYGIKVLSIDAQVQLRSRPEKIKTTPSMSYLEAAPFIETKAAPIQELAKNFALVSDSQRAQQIYDWVRTNISSVEYTKENKGAQFALTNKKGDCTEMAFLYTALARVNEIPSRIAAGFVVKDNSLLKPADYHNWAEYFEQNAWRIADAQKQVFDSGYSDYIAFRIFDSAKDSNLADAQRFMTFDPALVVKMN